MGNVVQSARPNGSALIRSAISDAQVRARVTPLGMGGEEKALVTMPIGEAPSYGNFFDMPGKGPFRIVIQVQRPGAGKVEAEFEHRH